MKEKWLRRQVDRTPAIVLVQHVHERLAGGRLRDHAPYGELEKRAERGLDLSVEVIPFRAIVTDQFARGSEQVIIGMEPNFLTRISWQRDAIDLLQLFELLACDLDLGRPTFEPDRVEPLDPGTGSHGWSTYAWRAGFKFTTLPPTFASQ